MQRLAIITSGGDSSGMNAALRSAVARGVETCGVEGGYEGLIRGALTSLDARDVSGTRHLGGTILGTARIPGRVMPR